MGANPFISHRMFVAALNSDGPTQPQTPFSAETGLNGAGQSSSNQITVEHLAALASRYWPDFPFALGMEQSSA